MIPLRLETLTTCPSPEAMRCGRNALVPWRTPNRLIDRTRSYSAQSVSSTAPPPATPALL
jgi:hypothetical protein